MSTSNPCALAAEPTKDTKSLALLQQYVSELRGPVDAVRPLRELQKVRSMGGFAHYTSGSVNEAFATFAGDARTPAEIFERTCLSLIIAIDAITAAIEATAEDTVSETPRR